MMVGEICDLKNYSDNLPHIGHIPPMQSANELEELELFAAEILRFTGLTPPIDALDLADAFGLKLCAVGPYEAEGRFGDEIRFHGRAPFRDRQESVSHSFARWAIMQRGRYATEAASRRLARAIMLPREYFLADFMTRRDLAWLLRRHPNPSQTMICGRVGELVRDVRVPALKRASASAYVRARALVSRAPWSYVVGDRGDGAADWVQYVRLAVDALPQSSR
jgi:hypothetical protein